MFRRLLASVFAVSLLCLSSHAEPVPASQRMVVMLSIDGFPAWLWHDPTMPIPNLRKLAAEGAAADSMVVSNPSITWINHTTLVTGVEPRRHGVLFNGLLHRGAPGQPPTLEQWADKAAMVHVPTLYDVAFKAGLKTAQVDWVAILNSGTIHHEFLELPSINGATEREMVADGDATVDDIRAFSKGANITWRDRIWTNAAIHIVQKHQPNLLLFHLLTTDSVNHAFGPGTIASYAAYGYADSLIGDLMRAVEKAGLKDRTTWLIVTDHGFKKVKRTIDVNVVLKDAGLIRYQGDKVKDCDAYAMPEGGLCFVYVTDPAKKAELLPKLKTLCGGIEGIDQVIDGEQAHTLGMPTPEENPGAGELILYAKPGYAFLKSPVGPVSVVDTKSYLGTHGYPASDPELEGIFIASGYGIKPGSKLGKIPNLDVAPTAARLLGVTIPDVQGKVLETILDPAAVPTH
jgi:predicted AlkP superfamily pyrophosphatase or phosphodiesterase